MIYFPQIFDSITFSIKKFRYLIKISICLVSLSLFSLFPPAFSEELPKIQLAKIYHDNIKLSEYFVSEKLDGIRAYWNGKNLISRQGNIFNAPKWFIKDFPKTALDGELWSGRNQFELVSSIVRKNNPIDEEWQKIHFMIFDMPDHSSIFIKRLYEIKKLVKAVNSPYLKVIRQFKITHKESLIKELDKIVKNGGEGLMLRKANSLYKAKRNDDLLKLKKYQDAEAKVISYIEGKGKYEGMMGALLVENIKDSLQFRIGTGFSDYERENPPKIGEIITYKYYGKTKNNIPRFASFLRIR